MVYLFEVWWIPGQFHYRINQTLLVLNERIIIIWEISRFLVDASCAHLLHRDPKDIAQKNNFQEVSSMVEASLDLTRNSFFGEVLFGPEKCAWVTLCRSIKKPCPYIL